MVFKRILIVCGVLALGAMPSFADIYGSQDPLTGIGYNGVDTYSGSANVYLPLGSLGAAGQTVVSYSFFSMGNDTNVLTPILWTSTGAGTFAVQAIGAADNNITSGVNNVLFTPVAGSAVVGANTYFGWVDGTADGTVQNQGTIAYFCCSGAPGGQPGYQTGDGNPGGYPLSLGSSPAFYNWASYGQGIRPYDMNVTTSDVTPEPRFYGVLTLCLAGLIVTRVRRKNA